MGRKGLLSIIDIEDKTKDIINKLNKESFIEDFLMLFDIPKTSITRAKTSDGDFIIRNRVQYRRVICNPLQAIDEIEQSIVSQRHKPRFIIATDFEMFYAKDTKTNDSLAIEFEDLPINVDFFLAWNGIEKADYEKESPADIKAAKRFTKLYDELAKLNPEFIREEVDDKPFNLFLIRSLFLYFAEDTGIISKSAFTNVLLTRTKKDGSDFNKVVKQLFSVLNIPENERKDIPHWLNEFPFVNGKLFVEPHTELNINAYIRELFIEAGELLKWNEINPDILGSMIQTVANKEERQVSGMHYTSVPNILKVINSLFLDDLRLNYKHLSERFDDYMVREITEEQRRKQLRDIVSKIESLITRISNIKVLDPACGSGNFLIITYKELRRLEIDCLLKIREIREYLNEKDVYQGSFLKSSKIKLKQFAGIEINNFAHEVARLSLYIAEHQMNTEMMESLADFQPNILPLQELGNIVVGNALRMDWNDVVPCGEKDEVYIIGNPPYIGTKGRNAQNATQKEDLLIAIHPIKTRIMDYIFGWFVKAHRYIYEKNAKFAFVSTNSLFQGEQAPFVNNYILNEIEISFAYPSFQWKNNAKNKAGVTVVIVGLANKNEKPKLIINNEEVKKVNKINCYLESETFFNIKKSNTPISKLLYNMNVGSAEYGKNNLIFSVSERENILQNYPHAEKYFKKYINAQNLTNGTYSYTLWVNDVKEINDIKKIPEIGKRLDAIKEIRSTSTRVATKRAEKTPWKFVEDRYQAKEGLVLPVVNSENRDYIPAIFVDKNTVVSNANCVIYDAPIWLMGIIVSRMHMTWLQRVGGRLKTDYRYAPKMVYNTFPIPNFSTHRKNALEEAVLEMLDIREEEGGILAELYGGANKPMNKRLREAHEKIDGIVERAYKQAPFKSDEERLNLLLKYYKEITSEVQK